MFDSHRGRASAPELAQEQYTSSQRKAGQQATANDHSDAGKNKSQTALIPDAAATVARTADTHTERDQQRADADLQAQQDMALYALLMLIATVATIIITGVGVWFVKRTLDATLQAVEDTGKATEAMLEANKIARETAIAQFRPYITARAISLMTDVETGLPHTQIGIKNIGAGPAYSCIIFANTEIADREKPNLGKVERLKGGATHLLPGETLDAPVRPLSAFKQRDIAIINAANPLAMWTHGRVEYLDTAGILHITHFAFVFAGQNPTGQVRYECPITVRPPT